MSKKSSGLLALVAGVAAGAAAVFLSKKENRQKAGVVLKKVEKKVEKGVAKARVEGKKLSKKISAEVKMIEKSPVLKKVGKRLAKKK